MKFIFVSALLILGLVSCNSTSDSASIGSGEVLERYDVSLTWTAVGDDGRVGQATAYDLRYSPDSTFLKTSWNQAQLVSFLPVPAVAGSPESLLASIPLLRNQKYFFAIKARDEAGNWSPISNMSAYVAVDSLLTQSTSASNE